MFNTYKHSLSIFVHIFIPWGWVLAEDEAVYVVMVLALPSCWLCGRYVALSLGMWINWTCWSLEYLHLKKWKKLLIFIMFGAIVVANVQIYMKSLRGNGATVTMYIAISATRGITLKTNHVLLHGYGCPVLLSTICSWTRSLVCQMDL